MFGRSKDASVLKVLIGVVVFVVTWALFIVSVSVFPALALWVFGVGFVGPYLKFAAFAYLAGMHVFALAMLALRH
ncbi:MAG: hypothetical protein HGB18_01290 [Candidatus Moranbacteria bacterium]|nr:hypothetical protein [Candidatus Moranbacteria bacterium]